MDVDDYNRGKITNLYYGCLILKQFNITPPEEQLQIMQERFRNYATGRSGETKTDLSPGQIKEYLEKRYGYTQNVDIYQPPHIQKALWGITELLGDYGAVNPKSDEWIMCTAYAFIKEYFSRIYKDGQYSEDAKSYAVEMEKACLSSRFHPGNMVSMIDAIEEKKQPPVKIEIGVVRSQVTT